MKDWAGYGNGKYLSDNMTEKNKGALSFLHLKKERHITFIFVYKKKECIGSSCQELLIVEGLTSINVYIIKFYDFYLFKCIHWSRVCNKFQVCKTINLGAIH